MDKKAQAYKKIGKRLRQLREAAGYAAAEDFAYEIDMARAQYAEYELGVNMKISSLLIILEAHGISLEEFFSEGFD